MKLGAKIDASIFELGDFVTIKESKPISKMKTWSVYETNEKSEVKNKI